MDILHIIVLALIQGLTEFLPISSSAHLILPSQLFGWPDQGLAFDVAVHVGTLCAVMIYFRDDIRRLIVGWSTQFTSGASDDSRLAWAIGVATIPAGLAGLLFNDMIETHLRSTHVIATTTLLFGFVLWWADVKATQTKKIIDMTITFAVVIGCAQAIALIPGTSRSGITITVALMLGFSRTDAARFSFLLSIPVILLSGGYKSVELMGQQDVDWVSVGLGALISGVSAFICIVYFLRFISKLSMLPFVIYRLILGVILIAMILIA